MWNWLFVDLTQRDSMYGPGYESKAEAIEATRPTLETLAGSLPAAGGLVKSWLAGKAADDVIAVGPFVWGLYRYDGSDEDRKAQADLWLVDFVGRMPGGVEVTLRPGDSL